MKAIPLSVFALALYAKSLAQTSGPTVIERGPHHRIVQTIKLVSDEAGNIIAVTNSYTEIATGMHHFMDGDGAWRESHEQFNELTDAFVATEGQHKLILTRNVNAPASVDLLLPNGQRLKSNPIGLSFFDTASGKNVLLGEVKDCLGELIAPNVVLFADAFSDIHAAIKFEYTKLGLSQDIILYDDAGLGSPADYGLNPESTLLEMYSEFHGPPAPVKSTTRSRNGLIDEQLDFDQMAIGQGSAYVLGQQIESVPISKTWTKLEGRDFLIESVPYAAIKPILEKAGVGGQAAKTDRKAMQDRKGLVRQSHRHSQVGLPIRAVVNRQKSFRSQSCSSSG